MIPESENFSQEIKDAKRVMENEAKAIHLCSQRLNEHIVDALDILFSKDKKVIVTGIGKSGHLAKKVAATLCSTGTPSAFMHPTEAIHGDLGIHQKNDPVIFLSNSGNTPELIFLEPVLRNRGARIVGILGNKRGPLAEKVDCVLDASVTEEADPLGIVPTSSFMVSSAICDAIASLLMNRRKFTENDYARTHPGGQLGRNLILRVKDVQQPLSKAACLQPQDTMREIVSKMTQFPLGAACVMEDDKLKGIITEGDIRRALNNSCEIDVTRAEEIMTSDPQQIHDEDTLGKALEIMERGATKISILPVLEKKNGKLSGLLRLHDIFS